MREQKRLNESLQCAKASRRVPQTSNGSRWELRGNARLQDMNETIGCSGHCKNRGMTTLDSFLYFAKSNSSHTLIDLISILSILSHDIILSYPSLHVHYLTPLIFLSRTLVYSMTQSCDRRVSTRKKEDGLLRPDRRQSEFPPIHPATPGSCPR